MSVDDFPVLDNLEMIVVVDNETDTLSSIDPGVDQVPEMASLLHRMPPTRYHDGHPGVSVFEHLCVACHGFSVLLRGRRGDEVRSVLFDVGPYGDTWLDNAARLGIELASIECVFLSHWHADHSGGFPVVVEAIAAARSDAGVEPPLVDLHPDRPDQRGVQLPSGTIALLPPEPTFDRDHGGWRKDRSEQRAPPCCRALRRQRPDRASYRVRDRSGRTPYVPRRPMRTGSFDPRRAVARCPRTGARGVGTVGVFACRRRERLLSRRESCPLGCRSMSSLAATTSRAQRWSSGSMTPSATSSRSSLLASLPLVTAPAGALKLHSPRRSPRAVRPERRRFPLCAPRPELNGPYKGSVPLSRKAGDGAAPAGWLGEAP